MRQIKVAGPKGLVYDPGCHIKNRIICGKLTSKCNKSLKTLNENVSEYWSFRISTLHYAVIPRWLVKVVIHKWSGGWPRSRVCRETWPSLKILSEEKKDYKKKKQFSQLPGSEARLRCMTGDIPSWCRDIAESRSSAAGRTRPSPFTRPRGKSQRPNGRLVFLQYISSLTIAVAYERHHSSRNTTTMKRGENPSFSTFP